MALLTAIGLRSCFTGSIPSSATSSPGPTNWFVIGLILFALVIHFFKDYSVLERYRYTIAFIVSPCLMAPRLPLIGSPGQRRLPGNQLRADLLPAGRAGQDRDRHLPRQLPA